MNEEKALPADPDLFPDGEEPKGKGGAAAQREIIEAGMANGGRGATLDKQVFGANVCPIRLPGHSRP
jgi:hypothetical protein